MKNEESLLTYIQTALEERHAEGYAEGQRDGFIQAMRFVTDRYSLIDKATYMDWVTSVVRAVKGIPQGIDGQALMQSLYQQLQYEEEEDEAPEEDDYDDFAEPPQNFFVPSPPPPSPQPLLEEPEEFFASVPADEPDPVPRKKKKPVGKKPAKKSPQKRQIVVAPDKPTMERTPGKRRSVETRQDPLPPPPAPPRQKAAPPPSPPPIPQSRYTPEQEAEIDRIIEQRAMKGNKSDVNW